VLRKGEKTRGRIVDRALRLAGRDGLEGLTIGSLATALGLSKSGLFAHFGSKDGLQLEVLRAARERFLEVVVQPALKAPRGIPRLRAFFEQWLEWIDDPEMPGGCIFLASAIELDDRPGPQRDFLVQTQKDWFSTLAKAVRLSVEEKHFRNDVDGDQVAFELYGIILAYHFSRRLLRDRRARSRAMDAYQRLIENAER
jgi:AcrR family transcriptional regulator